MAQDNIYPSRVILVDLDGDNIPETDITALVVSDIKGKNGSPNAKESDRISNAGNITFDIENKDQTYDGLDLIGKYVSIYLEYEGRRKQIFSGRFHYDIDLDSGPILPLHMGMTVNDW